MPSATRFGLTILTDALIYDTTVDYANMETLGTNAAHLHLANTYDGGVQVVSTGTAAEDAWAAQIDADATYRLVIDGDGTHHWGPGTAGGQDVALYRSAIGQLAMDGDLVVLGGDVYFGAGDADTGQGHLWWDGADDSINLGFQGGQGGTIKWWPGGTSGGTPQATMDATGAITLPGETIAGNLTFSGNGRRILGDLTNATGANRLLFQTSTANGNSALGVIPNGTGTRSDMVVYSSAGLVNASYLTMAVDSAAGITLFASGLLGTGAFLPISFQTSGAERMRLLAAGGLQISAPTSGVALTVSGFANSYAASVVGSATTGQSLGLIVSAGTNASDVIFACRNQSASQTLMSLRGDGALTVNPSQINPGSTVLAFSAYRAGGGVAVGYFASIGAAAGASYGLRVDGGLNATDFNYQGYNQGASVLIGYLLGNGEWMGRGMGNWDTSGAIYGFAAQNIANLSGQVIAQSHPTYSSINHKAGVEQIGGALGVVSRMRGVKYQHVGYHRTTHGTHERVEAPSVGLIMEELVQVVPEAVSRRADGLMVGIDYGRLVPFLIEAVKELSDQVKQLQAKES